MQLYIQHTVLGKASGVTITESVYFHIKKERKTDKLHPEELTFIINDFYFNNFC